MIIGSRFVQESVISCIFSTFGLFHMIQEHPDKTTTVCTRVGHVFCTNSIRCLVQVPCDERRSVRGPVNSLRLNLVFFLKKERIQEIHVADSCWPRSVPSVGSASIGQGLPFSD